MAKFNFRLQSVLDYRHTLADRARLELTAIQMSLSQEHARLEALRDAERLALARIEQRQRDVLDLPAVMRQLEHLHLLTRRIEQQVVAVAEVQAQVDRVQAAHIEAVKNAKAIELLRDRQPEEFVHEDRRLEQMETNEAAALQHQRLRAAM